MMPEFTKPTTMTVVADELCIMDVTASPVRRPATLLSVSFAMRFLRELPALLSSALPMMSIPNRNSASPPMRFNMSKISISCNPLCCSLIKVCNIYLNTVYMFFTHFLKYNL